MHNMPASRKTIPVTDASETDVMRCDGVYSSICESVCHLIYPLDGAAFYSRQLYLHRFQYSGDNTKALLAGLNGTKRGSIERRVLRGFLFSQIPLNDLNKLLSEQNVNGVMVWMFRLTVRIVSDPSTWKTIKPVLELLPNQNNSALRKTRTLFLV